MNIGMIARMDNSGLGSLCWETARHLKPSKVLLVENGVFQTFPERYKEFNTRSVKASSSMSIEDLEWLREGVDVVVSCETFYNDGLPDFMRKSGVKTALVTMCEMMPEQRRYQADLYICPSKLDYDMMPSPKVYIPTPVATDRLPWTERKEAKTFVHIASHGGMNGRKGTRLLLDAMQYVKSNIKLIITSWAPIETTDPRIEVRNVNFKNYWQIWREGDVLVYPQDYNGICLPVQEAFASGLGVVSTDIYPFNEYLPKDLLFKPTEMYKTRASKGLVEVDAARIDPKDIAEKIDEIAGKDISKYSKIGHEWAEAHSWKKLLPLFIQNLEILCTKQEKPAEFVNHQS